MFTGIVSDIGTVQLVEGNENLRRLRIACGYSAQTLTLGASIACSGICLTLINWQQEGEGCWFEVELAAETLRLTTAQTWQIGTRINLERALKIGDELGGHLVTGHVDCIAKITACEDITEGSANWGATRRFNLHAPAPLHRFIATKGSVTLDGTSLTVNTVDDQHFSVLMIPHTLNVTTWGTRKTGDLVNLEIDLMARYAARLAQTQ